MKRICTVVLVLISGIASAQNTLPVIPFGDRKADLYYWDTNWYDRYELLHPNEPVYPGIYSSFSHYPQKICTLVGLVLQIHLFWLKA